MDYPTGNFLYRSSTERRKDIKTAGRKDPVFNRIYVYNRIIIAHDFVPLYKYAIQQLSSLFYK